MALQIPVAKKNLSVTLEDAIYTVFWDEHSWYTYCGGYAFAMIRIRTGVPDEGYSKRVVDSTLFKAVLVEWLKETLNYNLERRGASKLCTLVAPIDESEGYETTRAIAALVELINDKTVIQSNVRPLIQYPDEEVEDGCNCRECQDERREEKYPDREKYEKEPISFTVKGVTIDHYNMNSTNNCRALMFYIDPVLPKT